MCECKNDTVNIHASCGSFFVDVTIRGAALPVGDDDCMRVDDAGRPRVGEAMRFNLTDGEPVEAMVLEDDGDAATLIFVDCLKDEYPLNEDGDYSGGYESSDLRKKLNDEILERFPQEIRSHMVSFDNGDMLRIPTEREIFGDNKYGEVEPDTVHQFEAMKKRRNQIAFQGLNGDWEWYWLQNRLRGVRSATNACLVNSGGYANYTGASTSLGVRPLFKYR